MDEGRPRSHTSKSWRDHKEAKKTFAREVRRTSREYENTQMVEVIKSNSADKSVFWQHLKKCRSPAGSKILAIKNKQGQVIYEIKDILNVWKEHFAALSTPKVDSKYDQAHFEKINKVVSGYNKMEDGSVFMESPITMGEVQDAVNKMKKKGLRVRLCEC